MPKIRKKSSPKKSPQKPYPVTSVLSLRTKLLLFTGLLCLSIPVIFYFNQMMQLMFFVPKVHDVARSTQTFPLMTQINIPAVHLSLPVEETAIRNNTWGVAGNGASHLNISASPGESGPIILYSHNTSERFGPIRWLKAGNEISLETADGKKHQYKVKETVSVDPDELTVFFKRKGEMLYLYTCDGFADLKRFIVIAEPIT
jgi:LPXTG-site transpeptidase (sortase) family protein